METFHILGLDVSKDQLDTCLIEGKTGQTEEKQIENQGKDIRRFFSSLKRQRGIELQDLIVCMEHTGVYNLPMLDFAVKNGLRICIEPALQIKQSQGMTRGKNDKVDAKRIAIYALKNRETLKFWKPDRPIIQKLKALLVLRDRLVRVKNILKVPVQQSVGFLDPTLVKSIVSGCKASIKAIHQDINKIETQLKELIREDLEISQQMKYATSVPGVGVMTGLSVIVATGEFQRITDPKKLACYAGVAPFEHSSGKYRGRTRVSKLANMNLKRLLHLGAMTAIQHCPELKAFYERKLEAGKNRMSVLNAVRNKLITRIYACVKNQRYYEKIFQPVLA